MENLCLILLHDKNATVALNMSDGIKSFSISRPGNKNEQFKQDLLGILTKEKAPKDVFIAIDGRLIYSAIIESTNLPSKKT